MDGFVPWPEETAQRYRARGYWRGQTFGDLLAGWAERFAARTAVVCGERRVTYRDLAERSARLALGLLERGIGPGDHVVLQLPNALEFLDVTFALLRLGARPVMALPPHRMREITHVAEISGAKAYAIPDTFRDFDYQALASEAIAAVPSLELAIVVGEPAASGFIDARALIDAPVDDRHARAELEQLRPGPGDVALFLLSGGTTGLPKLIPRTHDDYAYNARASAEVSGFDEHTVFLAVLPMAHNFPLACPGMFGTFHCGGTVVVAPDPGADTAFALIERERVTATALVPALAIRWMESERLDRHDLSSLALVQVGGSRLNLEAARRVAPRLGAKLQQVFGMAEGLLNYTRLDDPPEVVLHTQGRPMSPDDEIQIVDGDGNPVSTGESGELLTRGPYTPRGYFRAVEHNRRAYTADGFYRSGDVVRVDPGGNLIVEGREKDLVNRGGEKISVEEVENLILAHSAVRNVAAVAMPDPVLGERMCAYVVLRRGATLTAKELSAYLDDQRIAAFKKPERLELVDDLPTTSIGKIDKKTLRDDVAAKLAREGKGGA